MRYIDPHDMIDRRFAGRSKPDWRVAVVCFVGLETSNVLINRLHALPMKQRIIAGMDEEGDRPYVYEAVVGGKKVGLISGCWWGGPQAAIIVEELGCLGVGHIIGFGAAGSISRDLPKHTQIVATTGLVTDGTSRAYTRADAVSANPELLKILKSSVQKREVVPATIATVDAIYQETDAAVREWTGMGATAINMETTPLYAVSSVCQIRSLWLGFVSDCLFGDTWDSWHGRSISITEEMAETTASFLEALSSTLK